MTAEHSGITLDFTHAKLDLPGLEKLTSIAKEANLSSKIDSMFKGEKINITEKRSVLHVALRMSKDKKLEVEGEDVVKLVHETADKIKVFSQKIRAGEQGYRGYSGKKLRNFVVVGIGGSYLGPEFVYEALRYDAECKKAGDGFNLRFLANVDPIDFARATEGLDLEETLFIVNSKTFTTAETMLNARTCRQAIIDYYKWKYTEESDHSKFV